jgi:peptide/nickel transport system ATP-binding protein
MLHVDDLSVSFVRYRGLFGRTRVTGLSGLSIEIGKGEVRAVVGASGAGKSLLALAILGLLPPNAEQGGRIRFAGEDLTAERARALRGHRIAFVPQSIACLDPLARTGRQVAWAARRAGIPRRRIASAAREAVARFGLEGGAERAFPHELSGGMARRVLMAIATIGQADLLVLDEPTTGLDPDNIRTTMTHLRALADEGRAVLVITHDIAAVLPIADELTILRDGAGIETAPAAAFAGTGDGLRTSYARALWRALPQNAFAGPDARSAA